MEKEEAIRKLSVVDALIEECYGYLSAGNITQGAFMLGYLQAVIREEIIRQRNCA